MLLRWIVKNLLQEPAALAASVGGIAFALVVVLLVEAMFAGESERIVAYLEHGGADVWVMQSGVSNMHMATSLIGEHSVKAVQAIPGVASAAPILNVSTFLESADGRWYSYVIGVRPEDSRGGPWAMARGQRVPHRGEAVIPDVLARKAGLGIGKTIKALGETFTIIGTSADTYSMANSVTFVAYADLVRLLSVQPGTASYVLVQASHGTAPAELAERIRGAVVDVNAMTLEQAVERDRRIAMQMGADLIGVMRWVGASVAGLIVALTAYTATIRRARELGVVKALGFPNRALYLVTVMQSAVVAGLGYVVAVGIAYAGKPLVQAVAPEVALRYLPTSLVHVAVTTIAIALLASLVPGRRIAGVDPAVAFRE